MMADAQADQSSQVTKVNCHAEAHLLYRNMVIVYIVTEFAFIRNVLHNINM